MPASGKMQPETGIVVLFSPRPCLSDKQNCVKIEIDVAQVV